MIISCLVIKIRSKQGCQGLRVLINQGTKYEKRKRSNIMSCDYI